MRPLGFGARLGLAAAAYTLLVRPRVLRLGATEGEAREKSPDDDILAGAERGSTMATTIDAPPAAVWPWLVQMGYDRAGWYSWDRLDLFGRRSAHRLHPEWQSLSVGQKLASTPDGQHWFEVAAVDPGRYLALRAVMSGPRQYDASGPRPRFYTDSLWSFQLKELPGGRTRLVVRARSAGHPRLTEFLLGRLFWEPAHAVMQARQFQNLKRRVAEGRERAIPATTAPPQA